MWISQPNSLKITLSKKLLSPNNHSRLLLLLNKGLLRHYLCLIINARNSSILHSLNLWLCYHLCLCYHLWLLYSLIRNCSEWTLLLILNSGLIFKWWCLSLLLNIRSCLIRLHRCLNLSNLHSRSSNLWKSHCSLGIAFCCDNLTWNNFSLALFNSDITWHDFWSSISLFHSFILNNWYDLLLRNVFSISVLIDLWDSFLLNFHLVIICDFDLSGHLFILNFLLVFSFNSGHWNVLLANFSFDNIQRNASKGTTHLFFSDSGRETGNLLELGSLSIARLKNLGLVDYLLLSLILCWLIGNCLALIVSCLLIIWTWRTRGRGALFVLLLDCCHWLMFWYFLFFLYGYDFFRRLEIFSSTFNVANLQ